MIHGILNIYKEKGYTSHDVVAKLRGITGQRKIGHTGTLDPEAEGVLPVCLGRATKVCDLLTDRDKTYEAVLLLGIRTDTQDVTGTVTDRGDIQGITREMVEQAARKYVGEYDQIPPMYSALKVNGKKLYELAREGKTIERKARRVRIYELEILEEALPRVRLRVRCSKGTYIRTLCDDIGADLGCYGCMEALLRTSVGPFALEEACRLEKVASAVKAGELGKMLCPIDRLFAEYPAVQVKKGWEKLAYNGNGLKRSMTDGDRETRDGACVRIYDAGGNFLALYRYHREAEEYTTVKMFCGS
ncbi:tRNA pseudouridine(55) synthase TruB [Massilistercora timonensis]|uniref:tRNA pseudouridine(55) synthase TruB n=1 Tax=Massilistercora timonensis TaxID=2086584 RepID=UPI00320BAEAA